MVCGVGVGGGLHLSLCLDMMEDSVASVINQVMQQWTPEVPPALQLVRLTYIDDVVKPDAVSMQRLSHVSQHSTLNMLDTVY